MTDDMIERVSRAIFEAGAPFHNDCCLKPDFERCPCAKENAALYARAAIEAYEDARRETVEAEAQALEASGYRKSAKVLRATLLNPLQKRMQSGDY